ncbi:MAG TPA: TonB-dependent receptor [Bryobacteraceae bacterium]|nr:TonB-dependent receptor [Bryobacteraceae bacterium]
MTRQFSLFQKLAVSAVLLGIAAGSARAQLAGSAAITGTVTDPTGASVPGASLVILNRDTGITRNMESNEAGIYTAPFLPPGPYEVRATAGGFTSVVRTGLTLQVGQTLTVNFDLQLKTATETLTVSGQPGVVDTEKTEVSQVISEQSVSNLPIAGRRWDTFALLTPNVTADGGSGLVSYRGISGIYNQTAVDGANNTQAFFSESRGRAIMGSYVYSMDSIKEYQVSVSNYSAELGQAAGGIINAVTKSGSNDFHGDLFYYLRYPTFNALDSYNKSQGIYSQAIHQWQQFGGSFGGPLWKNRLFFFLTYDGSRKANPITYTSSSSFPLPCPAQVTSAQCSAANGYFSSLLGSYPRATNQDVGFGKLDYQASAKNHVSAAFDLMNYRAPNAYQTNPTYANTSLTTNGTYRTQERIFVANWDSTISSNTINNLRFQWGRDLEVAGANANAPYVSVNNVMTYGENYALPREAEPDEHRIQISEVLSITKGRHTLKTGVDLNFIHELMINLYNGTGQYNYLGTPAAAFGNWTLDVYGINTGDGLTGRHYSTFTQVTDPITGLGKDDFYNNDYAGFFEDTWRATPKLTLNLGVRYDLQWVPQPNRPNTLTPLTTLYTSTINIDKNNFAPRLGAAWQLGKGTVLRAGYGMFYGKTSNSTFYTIRVENGIYQQGFNCTPTSCPTLTFPNVIFTPPGPPLAPPFADAVTPQVTTFTPPSTSQLARGLSPDFVNPMVHQGEVTFERQIPGNLSISAAYVFSRGMHLPIFVDANLLPTTLTRSYDVLGPNAQTITEPWYTPAQRASATGVILAGWSDVNSWYNSMVLTLRRPMRHGLEFTLNYTLAKATDGGQVMGTNGTFNGTDYAVDPYNKRLEYGRSDLDQRQRFVGSVVWAPSAKQVSNMLARQLLDSWALSTIVNLSTGQPVTPLLSGFPSGGADGGLTGGVVSNGGVSNSGRAAWLPRAYFDGPNFQNVDFRLARRFAITERLRLQLLGEAFNLFNHTNIDRLNTTAYNYVAAGSGACAGHANGCLVPNAAFMAPTSTSNLLWGSRQLQVSGRISF